MSKFSPALTVLLLVLFSAANVSFAQNNNKVMFKSGEVKLPSNIHQEKSKKFSESELVNGNYYRLIQFNEIPSTQIKADLKENGIELLNYIPSNTYYAQISSSSNLNELSNRDVYSIAKIKNAYKLSYDLHSKNYKTWALSNDRLILNAIYFEQIPEKLVYTLLNTLNAEIIHHNGINRIQIEIELTKLNDLYSLPMFYYFEQKDEPGQPENLVGVSNHRSNTLATNYSSGLKFDGTGVTVMLQDNSRLDEHIDYTGRFTDINSTQSGDHGEHCGGTIAGAGNLDPIARGMAFGADVIVYNSSNNNYNDVPTLYNNNNLTITSKSYSNGTNAGYTSLAAQLDQQVRTLPSLMHVFSAGNGGSGGWYTITGGHKAGKNVIATGALDQNDIIASFSSRGPSADGRVKPDVCAVGVSVYSTIDPNTYGNKSGTSMACPGVAGTLAQLYHAYKTLNSGANPHSGLIKGTVMNTADDLGNVGPDYIYGWGRINARRAYKVISNNQYVFSSITQGASNSHTITVPAGTEQVKIMVYWNDYEGVASASPALVNDINMVVEDPNLTTYDPWILNPNSEASVAVRGVDNLNNMEQVTIDSPISGTYAVNVSGFSIPQGPQSYHMVYEFVTDDIVVTYPIGGENFDPNENEKIRWDAFGNTGTFTLEYSLDNGSNWNIISSSVSGTVRYYDWNVPTVVSGQALVRVSRGANSDISDANFSIIGVPTGLAVDFACPDSIRLVWNAVTGATSYEISQLGAMYMDSVGTSTTTSHIVSGLNPVDEFWFSVKAMAAGVEGRRAIAVVKNPGTFSCPIAIDGSVLSFVSPAASTLLDCHNNNAVQVTIDIENKGLSPISNFTVSYRVNGGAITTESITGPLNSLTQMTHTFTPTVNLSVAGSYNIESWITVASDGNAFNDTTTIDVTVVASGIQTLPFTEDFESFSTCGTASDCELTICTLGNGFINLGNGEDDDIDWRTDVGGTPSSGTGPSADHNPGTGAGKYLYTEVSGSPVCATKTAMMISPCIDLNGTTTPELRFWYHMEGTSMGSLHVDVFSGGTWTNDVMTPISGSQGANWLMATVDLSSYINQIINFRIRGITGSSWSSDIAIDDIAVLESAAPPAVAFSANITEACINKTVQFTDNSLNNPTSWAWSFTPNTVSFVNGTNSNSQNPQVQFNALGNYDVTLVATNSFGNNSFTQSSYININAAAALTVSEDFQSSFPPASWSLVASPSGLDWVSASVIGSSGTQTDAAYVDNYVNNLPGEESSIITMPIDLSSTEIPAVIFDVSYAPYSATLFDGLRIDVSTDCGETFVPSSYFKENLDLATVAPQTASWIPGAAADWRRDTAELASIAGMDANISFININNYGNGLYIDNIMVEDLCAGYTLNTIQIINNTCFGTSQGSVDIDITSGTAPYTYTWSNGFTTQDLANIGAGTYELTVTDVNGCERNGTYVVTEGIEIIATTSKQNVNCHGAGDGSASVVAGGGVPPFSYSWNTVPVQSSPTISNLGPAFYTVTITDNIGCTRTAEVEVREPDELMAFYVPTSPTSPNFNNGEINLLVTGGIAPYTFTWSNGETTEDLFNLTAGTYFCTVVDRRGCAVLVVAVLSNQLIVNNQQDRDGVIEIVNQNITNVMLYPNPTQGRATFEFSSNVKQAYSLELYDMNGALVFSKTKRFDKGFNQIDLNLEQHHSGEYLLRLASQNAVIVRKIILEK